MIEFCFVQLDNVGLSALVLGMAFVTGAACIQPPVITTVGCNVACHIFVAVQTELDLSVLLEGNVALAATGLDVGVTLYHLAWHHQRFEIAGKDNAALEDEQQAREDIYRRSQHAPGAPRCARFKPTNRRRHVNTYERQ